MSHVWCVMLYAVGGRIFRIRDICGKHGHAANMDMETLVLWAYHEENIIYIMQESIYQRLWCSGGPRPPQRTREHRVLVHISRPGGKCARRRRRSEAGALRGTRLPPLPGRFQPHMPVPLLGSARHGARHSAHRAQLRESAAPPPPLPWHRPRVSRSLGPAPRLTRQLPGASRGS